MKKSHSDISLAHCRRFLTSLLSLSLPRVPGERETGKGRERMCGIMRKISADCLSVLGVEQPVKKGIVGVWRDCVM